VGRARHGRGVQRRADVIAASVTGSGRSRALEPGADPDERELAGCFDLIREGRRDARLSVDDWLRLLKRSARQRYVGAECAGLTAVV